MIDKAILKRNELIQMLIDSAEDNDYGRGVKSAYKEELQALNGIKRLIAESEDENGNT